MDPVQNSPTDTPQPQPSHTLRNTLIMLGCILILFVVIDVYYIFTGITKTVTTTISTGKSLENQVNVSLKSQYDNPFDKNTQYVNPFSQSQNPFDNLAQ